MSKTYSNTCWQNRLLDLSIEMARSRNVSDALGHQLDPEFNGYPSEFVNPATGERQPVAPFQYLETHDHGRFLARLAPGSETDLIGQPYGERRLFYRIQPYVIALYTGKGVPMLWQGQEFGENWNMPGAASAGTCSSARCTGSISTTRTARRWCACIASWAVCGGV